MKATRFRFCLCSAIIFSLTLAINEAVAQSANTPSNCLQQAVTQQELNQCTGVSLADARRELQRVLSKIESEYSGNRLFIEALRVSQNAWVASVEADIRMKFPGDDPRAQFGSSYPMCINLERVPKIFERIEFLKQWLVGAEEGDICGGSIKSAFCLGTPRPEICSTPEAK